MLTGVRDRAEHLRGTKDLNMNLTGHGCHIIAAPIPSSDKLEYICSWLPVTLRPTSFGVISSQTTLTATLSFGWLVIQQTGHPLGPRPIRKLSIQMTLVGNFVQHAQRLHAAVFFNNLQTQ